MVGNIETLSAGDILSSLIDILKRKSWVYEIPKSDHTMIVNEIGGKSKIGECEWGWVLRVAILVFFKSIGSVQF